MMRLVAFGTAALLLSGCAVGPNFHRPSLPGTPAYQPGGAASVVHASVGGGAAGQAQSLVAGADVPGDWWKLFQVPELDALVARALVESPSLKSAQGALKAAWEQTKVQGAPLFPSISAEFNPTRNKTSRALSAVPGSNSYLYNLHTLQLNISYQPDLWGGLRRQIESAAAQAEMQRFQLEATVNTLINTLVVAVIQQASVQAQIETTQHIIDSQKKILNVLEAQMRLGDTSLANVMAQRAAVTQIEATLPPLQLQHEQAHDQIAVLVGATPDEALPEPKLAAFRLPKTLPASLPARLLEQRPDIRAAEAQMHTSSAQVGVAIANRLPNVQLTATPGQAVNAMSQFFTPGYGNWTIGAMVMQPIFQGFALLHLEREARGNLLASTEQYRGTVLSAIQNVADTLHALHDDADALSISAVNADAAQKSLNIARGQLGLGDISPVMLRSAEQVQYQAQLNLVQAQTARFSDSVALFQALGGGWWRRNDSGMSNPPANWQAAFTAPG